MNLFHYTVHRLSEGTVFGRVDDKAAAVTGNGEEVRMNLAANSGGCPAPGFCSKEVALNRNLLDFDFDSKVFEGRGGSRKDHNLTRNWTEFGSFQERNPMAGETLRVDLLPVEKDGKMGRLERNPFDNLSFHVFGQKLFVQTEERHRSAVSPLDIGHEHLQRQSPFADFLRPCFFVKNYPSGKIVFLSVNGKAFASGECGELADTELTDPVTLENGRLGAEKFFLGADDEILLESFQVHAGSVVLYRDGFGGDDYPNFCGIGIVGIVDQLADELDAFRIETLADGDQVTFIDSDGKIASRFHSRFRVTAFGGWL